jgi:fatty acid desaturase
MSDPSTPYWALPLLTRRLKLSIDRSGPQMRGFFRTVRGSSWTSSATI